MSLRVDRAMQVLTEIDGLGKQIAAIRSEYIYTIGLATLRSKELTSGNVKKLL